MKQFIITTLIILGVIVNYLGIMQLISKFREWGTIPSSKERDYGTW